MLSTYTLGAMFVVLVVPVRISAHQVRGGIKAVEPTAAVPVGGVSGLDPQVLHTLPELRVLRAAILATYARVLTALPKSTHRLLAENVTCPSTKISLFYQSLKMVPEINGRIFIMTR